MITDTFNDWLKIIDVPLLYQTLNNTPNYNICPEKADVFKAFTLCSLKDCKVVFLGQDPYPQKGIATGILFGNKADTPEDKLSPSLKVIKEAAIGFNYIHNYPIVFDNTLESWAKQGILMINSALTVEINKVGSHTNLWRPFISKLLKSLSHYQNNTVYVLFGQQAQTFEPYINKQFNYIIKENHPAFYARFNKSMSPDLFININKYLKEIYNQQIVWYNEFNEEVL